MAPAPAADGHQEPAVANARPESGTHTHGSSHQRLRWCPACGCARLRAYSVAHSSLQNHRPCRSSVPCMPQMGSRRTSASVAMGSSLHGSRLTLLLCKLDRLAACIATGVVVIHHAPAEVGSYCHYADHHEHQEQK